MSNSNPDNSPKRFLVKEFKCSSCLYIFKKLVQKLITKIQCPHCKIGTCTVINNNNSSPKTPSILSEESKIKTNNNFINNTETKKKEMSFLNKKKLLKMIKPFSVSPFANSIQRPNIDLSEILEDRLMTNVNENFFLDNYASNFVSNFYNPMGRNVFINLKIKNNSKNKCMPLTAKELKQVQKIKMQPKFCKCDDENNIELPTCIFCIKDIQIDTDCFLLRCGHLIHEKCFLEWTKEHKICPVCEFEIIKKSIRKSSLDIMTDNAIKEDVEIGKSISESSNKLNGKDFTESTKKILDCDENINIIGERNNDFDLFFEEELK